MNLTPHLAATLVTLITQASRIPLSSQDSEFISTMAPTHPNKAVQRRKCRNTWRTTTGWNQVGGTSKVQMLGFCVCVLCVYPVSVDDPQAARIGANPLLFDVVQHVDEQRAVHLVGQVDRRMTLQRKRILYFLSTGSIFLLFCRINSVLRLTLMFSVSTLAPADSRMWAASTLPASTAQCSGVFLFSLSTALTEALFFMRKLLGSGLGQITKIWDFSHIPERFLYQLYF